MAAAATEVLERAGLDEDDERRLLRFGKVVAVAAWGNRVRRTPALYRREEARVAWPGAGAGAGADSGQGRHVPRVPDRAGGGACSLILMESDGWMDGWMHHISLDLGYCCHRGCLFVKLD